MGAGASPAEPEFFCVVIQSIFRQFATADLVTKRSSVSRCGIRKDIFKNFHFMGHLPPKSEIENRSNRHLTQSRLQITRWTAKRYCLHCSSREFPMWVNFSLRRTVVELRASKLPNFRILAYFPHTKPVKRTFRWPAYSSGVTSQNDSDFSMW